MHGIGTALGTLFNQLSQEPYEENGIIISFTQMRRLRQREQLAQHYTASKSLCLCWNFQLHGKEPLSLAVVKLLDHTLVSSALEVSASPMVLGYSSLSLSHGCYYVVGTKRRVGM